MASVVVALLLLGNGYQATDPKALPPMTSMRDSINGADCRSSGRGPRECLTTPLKGLERGTTDKPGTDERKQSEWTEGPSINDASREGGEEGVTQILTRGRKVAGIWY